MKRFFLILTSLLLCSSCQPSAGLDETTEKIVDEVPVEAVETQENKVTLEKQDQPQPPQVCADDITAPAPFGAFEPAQIQLYEPGFSAEMFIAPGEFNMPQEVFTSPDNEVLVYEVRGHALSRIEKDGTITLIAEDLWGYQGDMDEQGNIFLHMHPSGMITRVSPEGEKTIIVQSPDLQAACDCGFGLGPDGNLYVVINPCGPNGDLYRITTSGEYTLLSEVPQTQAFHTDNQGRFLAATWDGVYEVSQENFKYKLLEEIPGGNIAPGGLTTDDAGNIYVSTGARSNKGEIYKLDQNGNVTLLAEIPQNGLSGIEWLPDTKEIIGGQLRQGGVLAVGVDGSIREIVSGNGIITPMGIEFSPCGDLAIPNDDGGMMSLADPQGTVSWLMDYVTFIPPMPFVAFDKDANLYASEGAPGFDGKLIVIWKSDNTINRNFKYFTYPSGLAFWESNKLFISETGAGNVIEVDLGKKKKTSLVEGLKFPQALTFDQKGNLFVVTGPDWFSPDPKVQPAPLLGDKIEIISPSGEVTSFANLKNVKAIEFSPDGDLFATAGGLGTDSAPILIKLSTNGQQSIFADGFESVSGLAFDLAGNLYIADDIANGIIRIGGFPTGTISLTIVDASGRGIPEARVQVYSEAPTLIGQVVFSDSNGKINLQAAPREYSIFVSADGYKNLLKEKIQITADQEYVLELRLDEK